MSETIKDALSLLAIFALGLLLWVATPGDAHAAILTPEGATVFGELWEWFKVFTSICFIGGLAWIAYALIRERVRPAIPDQQHEYERDAL